jgi:hypothetical protein
MTDNDNNANGENHKGHKEHKGQKGDTLQIALCVLGVRRGSIVSESFM